MDNETRKPQPDIMPPLPDTMPGPDLPEIPPDKNAPEKQAPTRDGGQGPLTV